MQGGRKDMDDLYDTRDAFGNFYGFGSHGNMMPSLFGGRDPFDDPFFTRPFASVFDRSSSSTDIAPGNTQKGIVIQELNTDHDGDNEDIGPGNHEVHSASGKEPSVEHPDDDIEEGKNEEMKLKTQPIKAHETRPQARSFSFQTCKVTYGGVDGAYYTSTRTRRTGNDGVVLEENKEADRTTGQAAHRISRGINDKGHSYSRTLNSDGKVDTLQTLHNLNEDELAGFEEAWKGNANRQLPKWGEGFDSNHDVGSSQDEQKGRFTGSGLLLRSSERNGNTGISTSDNEASGNFSGGRGKKVVRINID